MRIWWGKRCWAPACRRRPSFLKTETPLTKAEAIQALQAVLALNGIALIDVPGGKFVKVVGTDQAGSGGRDV